MLQDCKPQLIPISLFLMSLIQMQSLAGNERKTNSNGIFNVLGKDTFLFFFSVKAVNQRIYCDIKNL